MKWSKLGTAIGTGAVALIAYVSVGYVTKAGIGAYQRSESNVGRLVDDKVGTSPMGMALKETYPAEWKRFREELIKTAADPEIDSTKMRSYSFNYMRSFMLTKTEALVSAPDLEMSRMFVSDGAFLRQLKADNVSICATHAMVGLGANVQVSPAALRLMQDSVVFRMRAARAGEVTPVQRPEVSELDFIALETAMIASGASEENAEAFFNGTIQAKSESAQCSTGINMYDALEMIPVDQAGRIYALVQKNSRGAANY